MEEQALTEVFLKLEEDPPIPPGPTPDPTPPVNPLDIIGGAQTGDPFSIIIIICLSLVALIITYFLVRTIKNVIRKKYIIKLDSSRIYTVHKYKL